MFCGNMFAKRAAWKTAATSFDAVRGLLFRFARPALRIPAGIASELRIRAAYVDPCPVEAIGEGIDASYQRLEIIGVNLSAIGVDRLLRDKTRKPGIPPTSEGKVRELAELAQSPPPDGETHWTVRALAEEVGIGASTAHVILVRNRLAPHRWRHFKISNDPDFVEKTRGVAGFTWIRRIVRSCCRSA